MTIELNHTVVPARDKVLSAKFFARIFGLPFDESAVGYFAPVRINKTLTLDFVDSKAWTESSKRVATHHYAFKVSEKEFDEIFSRIQAEAIPYGSEPYSRQDMKINHRGGGRGVYFDDPDGHVLELLTVE
jgi:catechol 2,3-dioxygenase-like lactoylglutathione lyase family enzyme